MCGIAAIVNYQSEEAVDRHVIEAMVEAMHHRGPDDVGCYLDRYVGLGHRRLSIIDRSGGHQPMCNEDGTVWISFNGEIYNFRRLREELLANGHAFQTQSDTEVIVHLYEDLGEQCVHRLHGMFAFIIWDSRKEQVFIARDRVGIKPLYYWISSRGLALASEMKALLAVPDFHRELNLQALHEYLTLGYTIAPRTILHNVMKLEPGHLMVVLNGSVRIQQYWDLDYSKKTKAIERDLVDEFSSQLTNSIRTHLVGEVPIGILLSGGLDSTGVTALVAQQAGHRLKTFSIGYADHGFDIDERAYARLAAQAFNTEHHEVAITPETYRDTLEDYVWHMDEPMADPASIPLYCVSQLAKDSVKVVLSGEGSDELLAGYSFWMAQKGLDRAQAFRKLPRWFRSFLLRPLNEYALKSGRLSRYMAMADRPLADYFQFGPPYMSHGVPESARVDLYGPAFSTDLRPSLQCVIDGYRRASSFEFLDQMLYVYTKQWMPDDLLLKADKMTMAHSLELRVPFLDHNLVELAAALPDNMKMRANKKRSFTTKHILREALQGIVPDEILHRKKMGFHVPLPHYLRTSLKTLAYDLFRSESFRHSGLFRTDKLMELVKCHSEGRNATTSIWPILVFALWHQRFIPLNSET
ncbi:asparagine synthase (glutamine-hydrolyzing) [Nitrospira sp. Nam74]